MKFDSIVFDLDGTLLDDTKSIQPLTKKLIIELQNNGVTVILASSRSYGEMVEYAEELLMFQNGTGYLVYNGGTQLFSVRDRRSFEVASFQKSNLKKLLAYLNSSLSFVVYTAKTTISVLPKCDAFDVVKNIIKLVVGKKDIQVNRKALFFLINICEISKIRIWKSMYPSISFGFSDASMREWCVINDNVEEIEILPKGASKLKALFYIAEHFNLKIDTMMYFGDGENDIECLKALKFGVAMINSHENVKTFAKYISFQDNNSEGIYTFITHMLREEDFND